MHFRISFKSLKTSLFFLFTLLFGYSAQAAQFTASLIVSSPGSEVVYDLKVKDNMYRIEKVKGLSFIPPMPTIHNRSTGISWGLNSHAKQYIEQTDPAKTMMMDPVAGWEFMRKNLKDTQTGTEMIESYSCQVHEYRQQGNTRIENRVWVSTELGFTLKEIQYALNGDVTLTLKNIKEGSVDPALFEIPPGYSQVVVKKVSGDKSTKNRADKPVNSAQIPIKKPKTTSVAEGMVDTILIPQTLDEVKVLKSRVMASDKSPFMNGEVPLYDGAKIIKSKSYDSNVMLKLEATATPEDVVEFYKKSMLSKGWKSEMILLQGNKGVLMFKKLGRQLVIKVKGKGVISKIDMTIIGQ